MKLSEAMRRGSKMCKQVRYQWAAGNGGGCAMAAVALGVGLVKTPLEAPFVQSGMIFHFPELVTAADCPSCSDGAGSLMYVITHINDFHGWTRERIAGWIEATYEVPIYSMLEIQEYMGEPVMDLLEVPRV